MKSVVAAIRRERMAAALALVTLLVYLPGLTWGIPYASGPERVHSWGNDDAAPLAALAEMHDTFVIAPPNRNVAYPWFHYFLMACVMAPYLVWLYATGGFSHPSPVFPFGIADPVTAFFHLSWLARSLSIALGVAAVLGAYFGAKYLWGSRAGLLSALFTMLMFPMAYYAKLTNPDMPVLGWTSLGLAAAALSLRHGFTPKRAAWLGTFIALAAATKDQSIGSFVFLVPALLFIHFRHGTPDRFLRWRTVWAAPAAGVLAFAAVYVLASGILVDPVRYGAHVTKVLFAGTARSLYLRHPATLSGALNQTFDLTGYLFDVMGSPLLVAALAGIVLALRYDRRPLILLLSSLGFFLMLVPVGMSRIHYLLAVALPLNYFAAFAFNWCLERKTLRVPAIAAASLIVGMLLLQTVDLTYEMVRDSRYAAGDWLDANTRPGDRVLHFGFASKLPRLRADVGQIRILSEHDALPSIRQQTPEFIIVVPQDINDNRHRVQWRRGINSAIAPLKPEIFRQLTDEELGYRLIAQFQTPRLMPWLQRPFLSYPTVNPPVQIFARMDRTANLPKLQAWYEAPHYPSLIRVRELTVDDAVR